MNSISFVLQQSHYSFEPVSDGMDAVASTVQLAVRRFGVDASFTTINPDGSLANPPVAFQATVEALDSAHSHTQSADTTGSASLASDTSIQTASTTPTSTTSQAAASSVFTTPLVATQNTYAITLTAPNARPATNLLPAKHHILQNTAATYKTSVQVPYTLLYSLEDGTLKSAVATALSRAVAPAGKISLGFSQPYAIELSFGLEANKSVDIIILSPSLVGAEEARTLVLVAVDQQLALHSEHMSLDYKTYITLAGMRREAFRSIQQETSTNIYVPSPFFNVFAADDKEHNRQNTFYITGQYLNVRRAKVMLQRIAENSNTPEILSKTISMSRRKLEWILHNETETLRESMIEGGVYIDFPGMHAPYVSDSVSFTLSGLTAAAMERTVRLLMKLACAFYECTLTLSEDLLDALPLATRVSGLHLSEIVYNAKSRQFSVYGSESAVRLSAQKLVGSLSSATYELLFRIELGNEHNEFISGKKNGKLNKIIKATHVHIDFDTSANYNFFIVISGRGPVVHTEDAAFDNDSALSMSQQDVLQGLNLLLEELPAELSFYVPELYHKRIIGVGGKNIQRIMKKYGVYVKFSSSEEAGMYLHAEDNVMARTPAKNAYNLRDLKTSIMDSVNMKDRYYAHSLLQFPHRYHRLLVCDRTIVLKKLELSTSSKITFPPREAARDALFVFGPQSQMAIIGRTLLNVVPFDVHMKLPASDELRAALDSPEFVRFQQTTKAELGVTLVVHRSTAHDTLFTAVFSAEKSDEDLVYRARDQLEAFLGDRRASLLPHTTRAALRAGETPATILSQILPHYERQANRVSSEGELRGRDLRLHSSRSSLFSSGSSGQNMMGEFDFEDAAMAFSNNPQNRGLRMASSTPDIKAIFNRASPPPPVPPVPTVYTQNLTQPANPRFFGSTNQQHRYANSVSYVDTSSSLFNNDDDVPAFRHNLFDNNLASGFHVMGNTDSRIHHQHSFSHPNQNEMTYPNYNQGYNMGQGNVSQGNMGQGAPQATAQPHAHTHTDIPLRTSYDSLSPMYNTAASAVNPSNGMEYLSNDSLNGGNAPGHVPHSARGLNIHAPSLGGLSGSNAGPMSAGPYYSHHTRTGSSLNPGGQQFVPRAQSMDLTSYGPSGNVNLNGQGSGGFPPYINSGYPNSGAQGFSGAPPSSGLAVGQPWPFSQQQQQQQPSQAPQDETLSQQFNRLNL